MAAHAKMAADRFLEYLKTVFRFSISVEIKPTLEEQLEYLSRHSGRAETEKHHSIIGYQEPDPKARSFPICRLFVFDDGSFVFAYLRYSPSSHWEAYADVYALNKGMQDAREGMILNL